MEDFRNCPICLEVPEKEIYQCSEGHTICNVCISKLTECPQCRTKYGRKLIRSRVLETLLDGQIFECKFSENGCHQMCWRSEISFHADSCEFNTDLINLCGLLGRNDCVFKIDGNGGGYSEIRRTEIITHFTDVHKKSYGCTGKFAIGGESIKTRILECLPGQQQNISLLCSLTDEVTSPLFLVTMKICTTANSISFTCIQLWGKDTHKKYKVQFSFVNGTCSAKAPIAKDVLSNIIRKLDPLLISWTLNVYTPLEAEYVLKSCPVYIHIPVLTDAKFGDNTDDNLLVEISLIT